MKLNMKNLTFSKVSMGLTTLALLAVFGLAGCGGGGGGDSGGASSSTSTEFSGIASKGPILNGTITAFKIVNIDNKEQKGAVLNTVHTDHLDGTYKLNLGTYSGPVLIEVTGGSYRDEATGNILPLASTLRAAIANVIPNKSGITQIVSASVTPITEAAVKNAEVGTGGLTPTNIQTANDNVKTWIGFDPVSTQPADATNTASASASTAAKAYAALLGTVSQYLKDNPSKSLDNATSDFSIALKADGSGLAGNALITAAGNNFGANANNKTGVYSMAALQTLTATLATIDDENPVSQRTVAEKLFKEELSECGDQNSVGLYPTGCSVKYNYNLSGMPGCFGNAEESNYISNNIKHYSKNDNSVDWKTSGFLCTQTNLYAADKWSMNDGRVMDGTHNGIDFRHKDTMDTMGNKMHPAFYAIAPGVVINAGTPSKKSGLITIAIYDDGPNHDKTKNLTTLYLHASSVNKDKVYQGAIIEKGDLLGYQGNTGLGFANEWDGEHVHISVRSGQSTCACGADPITGKGGDGYLPPVATLLTYLSADTTAPAAPTGVTATAGNGQATISWNAVSGVTSYNIYWSTSSGVSKTSYTGKISNVTNPYTHTGRTNGTTYYYIVTAVNSYGESLGSSEVSAKPVGTGTLQGYVKNAVTKSAISNVTVSIYDNTGILKATVNSDSSGVYSTTLAVGTYSLSITKTGYITDSVSNLTITENVTTTVETVLQIGTQYSGTGNISGKITNALDGTAVSSVTLNFRTGINVTTGTVVATTTTNSYGSYTVSGLNAGNYTGEAVKSGFTIAYFTVTVIGGQANYNQDTTITPILSSGETRVVLTWGSTPSDMDSHLTGPISGSTSRFHVYFNDEGSSTYSPYASLDVDDMSSYGPETITIYQQFDGIYRYSVHDYSNKDSSSSTALSNSSAQAKVYRGSNLVATFNVPPNKGGTLWTVFEMSGDTITPINTMFYSSGGYSVQSPSLSHSKSLTPHSDALLMRNLPAK